MATVDGARAAGFGNEIGVLQPGFKADMILVNLKRPFSPFMSSTVSISDIIVHRLKAIDVDTVIVDGEIIMKDKQLTHVDKAEVVREVRRSFKEVDSDTRKKLEEYNEYVTNFYREWDKEAIGYTYNTYHTTA
jgi:5-methylthioadenosine/S-adenosylhomocysteine deaminase